MKAAAPPPKRKEWTPKSGRLNIKIVRGRNFVRNDPRAELEQQNGMNIYFKFLYGGQREPIVKSSEVFQDCDRFPFFNDTKLHFDIQDPKDFVRDGDLPLKVEAYHRSPAGDELIGVTRVSTLPYFEGGVLEVEYTLQWTLKSTGELKEAGILHLEVMFSQVNHGMLVVTAFNGRHLKNMDQFGRQDPYCKFQLGKNLRRGKTIKEGGSNPYFGEEEFEFWVDHSCWAKDLMFQVFDEDVGTDDFIGGCAFSILDFLNLPPGKKMKKWVPILDKKGTEARGEVELGFEFFVAGKLRIWPKAGRRLFNADPAGQRQDPYVLVKVDSAQTHLEARTITDKDGGTEPVWSDKLEFDIVNQYELEVIVMDEDFGSDDLIGKTKVNLLPYFRHGHIDEWIKIFDNEKDWGDRDDMGEIRLIIDFAGPPGVRYPQRQDLVDTFDEKERVSYDDVIQNKLQMDAIEDKRREDMRDKDIDAHYGVTDEFTDKEIFDAFRYIDLDKNMFIGSAEIRHILICMGELVTDGEINEMIRMCDTDGDGQVSYEEFYRLAKHPDPSRPDFNSSMAKVMEDADRQDAASPFKGGAPPPPPRGQPFGARGPPRPPPRGPARGPRGVPMDQLQGMVPAAGAPRGGAGPLSKPVQTNAERQRQMIRKAEKRKLLGKFQDDNNTDMDFLEGAFKQFSAVDTAKTGRMNLKQFLRIMGVEATGEYKRLFSLFDADNSGTIDVKEFMLGLSNFASEDKEKRVNFCFLLYDEDNNGFITEEELISVLRANHMAADDQQVVRKAKTIMRQADANNDGRISPEEFIVIAQKFPNILFPAAQFSGQLRSAVSK